MRRSHQDSTQVHECAFEANIVHTNAAVKFSCKMFVAWKNMTNKIFCRTLNDNVAPLDGVATFHENLSFQTYLLYDKNTAKYLRKETSLCLLLVSARKPDEEKLVGRVVVDLAQILNVSAFQELQDHKLAFCSISNATLTFHIKCLFSNKTDMRPLDLDMDEFSIIARNLNQSGSSNNEDLVALKTISKDLSSHSADKRNEEKGQQADNDNENSKKESGGKYQQQIQQTPKFETIEEKEERKYSIDEVQRVEGQTIPAVPVPVLQVVQIEPEEIGQEEKKEDLRWQKVQPQIQEVREQININNQAHQQVIIQPTEEQVPVEVEVEIEEQAHQPTHQIHPNQQPIQQIEHIEHVEQVTQINQQPNDQVIEPEPKAEESNEPIVEQPATQLIQQIQIESSSHEQPKQYTWYQQDPSDTHVQHKIQPHAFKLESRNSEDIMQLKFQNKKLMNQNQKLLELYQQTNSELEAERGEAKKWKKQVQQHQQRLVQMESDKNDIVQQLLLQTQATSRECIQLSAKLKLAESSVAEVEKLKKKLAKSENQLEESETLRLDTEAEALQIKYQLAELKLQFENKQRQLKGKDEQIQRMVKQIQQYRLNKVEEGERSLYRSYSIMSDKEREGFNEEIEGLKRKLNRLTTQLQFTQNVKDNLSHLSQACEHLSIEKQTLLFELSKLRREKDQILAERSEYEASQLKKEKMDNQNLNHKLEFVEEELKAVECELGRYETERVKLQKNVDNLEQENKFLKELLVKKEEQTANAHVNAGQQNGQLSNTMKELQKECERLTTSLGEKQRQLFKLQAEFKKRDNLVADKEKQIETVLSEKRRLTQDQQKLEKQLEQKVAFYQKEQKTLKQQISNLQNQVQASITEAKNKQVLILAHEQTISTLKSQSQKQQTELSNKVKSLEKQISKLQKQTSQFKNVVDSLQADKAKLQEANKQHSLQKDALNNENQYLKAQVKDMQASASASAQVQRNGAGQTNTNSYLERVISDKNAVLELKEKQIQQMAQSMEAEAIKVLELEERISRFAQKELKMRENILILQEQSRKIYDIVVEKEQNEEMQVQLMEEKDVELEKVRVLLDDQILVNRIAQEELMEYKKQLITLTKQLKDAKEQNQQPKQEPVVLPKQAAKQQQRADSDGYNQLLRLDNERIRQLEQQLSSVLKQHKAMAQQKDRKLTKLQGDVQKQIESKLVMEHEIKLLRNEKNTNLADIVKLKDKIKSLQAQIDQLTRAAQQNQLKLNKVTADANAKQEQYSGIIKDKDNKVQQLLFRIEQLELEWEQKEIRRMSEPQIDSNLEKQKEDNLKRVAELCREIEMLETQLVNQDQQIKGLKAELESATTTIKDLKNQVEDSEVEKMNKELEKQFQLVRDKSKDEIKKSGIMGSNDFALPDIVSACKSLQELLKQRSEKNQAQTIVQLMANKNAALEEEVIKIAEQRGLIQENARKLSMQFQKVKAKILKGKGSYQEKTQLLVSLKPCEGKVKDLVEITERIFDSQFEAEAF